MKRLLIFCFIVNFCHVAFCQDTPQEDKRVVFGLKTGANLAFLSASVNSDATFRTGFHFGPYLKIQLDKKSWFRPEVYYSQQGQKENYITPPNGPSVGKTTKKINYINLALLAETAGRVAFQAGPQLGFNVYSKEQGTVDNAEVDLDLKPDTNPLEIGIVAGLAVNITSALSAGARLNYGITHVDKHNPDISDISFRNRVLHFFIGYSF